MYLLDTNVVSEFLKPRPNAGLLQWMEEVAGEALAVSVLLTFEIQLGIERSRASGNHQRADRIARWLDGMLDARTFELLPFDVPVARLYAEMFAAPPLKNFLMTDQRSKQPKSGVDLMLAATAIVHGTPIVTFNIRDFQEIHGHFPLPGLFEPSHRGWVIGRANP